MIIVAQFKSLLYLILCLVRKIGKLNKTKNSNIVVLGSTFFYINFYDSCEFSKSKSNNMKIPKKLN